MDPLSQGTVGAVFSQAISRNHMILAGVLGFLSGMEADLDVLIRSDTDPLLFLEYHRQFTHSILFMPIGGLLCALVFHLLLARWWQLPWRKTWLFCTIGYATHALLDACTSYGTQLFWPFSNYRVAWSTVSIIDPLVTLPLVLFMVMAMVSGKIRYPYLAVVWLLGYMLFGLVQQQRAVQMAKTLAQSRGHVPIQLEAKPSFANQIVWKTIYQHQGRYYVDAIRTGWHTAAYPGDSIAMLDVARDFPWLDANSQQAKDIERFRWFSQGYLAVHSERANYIGDMRYSLLPHKIAPLWMVVLDPKKPASQHVGYAHEVSRRRDNFKILWKMVKGEPI